MSHAILPIPSFPALSQTIYPIPSLTNPSYPNPAKPTLPHFVAVLVQSAFKKHMCFFVIFFDQPLFYVLFCTFFGLEVLFFLILGK